jgi:hypothetical protein
MKLASRNKVAVFVSVFLALAVFSLPVSPALAQIGGGGDYGVRQQGGGKYAQLTADWWKWILEQPVTDNPNLDETGLSASIAQPGGKVFLLAGGFGGTWVRHITVPAGKAMFMPILNTVTTNDYMDPSIDPLYNDKVPYLRKMYNAAFIDLADPEAHLYAYLNGKSLLNDVVRVKSPVFAFTLPTEDPLISFDWLPGFRGPIRPTVSDGYWLYIPPLEPGEYALHFGTNIPGVFSVDVTDYVTVQ